MKFKLLILIGIIGITNFSVGQNLVENGSFETLSKKPKNPGEIYLAAPWIAGTKTAPDLYSRKSKNDDLKVPINKYGDEEPKEGDNYAGILMYSDREKEPRSYLSAKLKYPMLAGEYYCVKFHISFADLSKYASNNIGAYISHDSIGSETELILKHKPQVMNSTNRVFEKQWHWEDICRIYVADGGEQYITIGNFAPQSEMIKHSVKRPPGYTSTQLRNGYYFIDDISILPNATPENCKCEPGKFAFANLNPDEAEFSTNQEDVPDQVIISTTGTVHGEAASSAPVHDDVLVQFASNRSSINTDETAGLADVATFMKENEGVIITVIGHSDPSEKRISELSFKRMNQVIKYLISNGISEERISEDDAGNKNSLDISGSPKYAYKNMVVEIKFY
jgi:outer membrane protein OmpA-like peptidoglycan-associated protein